MMDFLKINFKYVVMGLYLAWRVVSGMKPGLPKKAEAAIKKVGGIQPIVNLVRAMEEIELLHGSTKRVFAVTKLQEVFKDLTKEDLPEDVANCVVEVALQKMKELL